MRSSHPALLPYPVFNLNVKLDKYPPSDSKSKRATTYYVLCLSQLLLTRLLFSTMYFPLQFKLIDNRNLSLNPNLEIFHLL